MPHDFNVPFGLRVSRLELSELSVLQDHGAESPPCGELASHGVAFCQHPATYRERNAVPSMRQILPFQPRLPQFVLIGQTAARCRIADP